MAKKQGANTSLIQGAGVAYRDYSNAPGMYSGLDKIIKVGTDMSTKAMQDFEAEQLRVKQEEEDAKKLKAQQDKDWYNLSGDVYANAGSFMKDVEYKDTSQRLTALKQDFIDAQNSGDPEEMAAVQIKFNNIKSDIDDHKAFRETITNPDYGLSAAMDHSGVFEGDNGEDKAFMTKLIAEEYEIKDIDGKKHYVIDGVAKTMKEIKEMAVVKDLVPFNKYHETRQKYSRAKNFNKEDAHFEVRNNVIPKDINGLRAFLADDGFGNGKNFTALLNDSKNKEAIKKEISTQLFDTDNSGDISDTEYDEFVLAFIDPKHKTWLQEDGTYDNAAWQNHATQIATEQLVNGMNNAWNTNNPPTPTKTKTVVTDPEDPRGPDIETKSMAKYVNSTIETGSYEPFEGSDGNLVEGDLLIVGYNNVNDSFQVQDSRGLLHDIPAKQREEPLDGSGDAGEVVNTIDINKL